MTQWDSMKREIVREYRDNPDSWLQQPMIKRTMHPSHGSLAMKYLDYLRENAPHMLEGTMDNPYAKPTIGIGGFSLSTLQYLYYIHLIDMKIAPTNQIKEICEIGAGYALLPKLLEDIGFEGDYLVVDFPEFREFQSEYIKSTTVGHVNTTFRTLNEEFSSTLHHSLMLATFSLNEMPLADREKVIENLNHESFMFVFNRSFDGVDNLRWFNELALRLEDRYIIETWKCPIHYSATIMVGSLKV